MGKGSGAGGGLGGGRGGAKMSAEELAPIVGQVWVLKFKGWRG